MKKFEKLDYGSRTEKYGVIAKIKFDTPSDGKKRTVVYPYYKELMKTGKWIDVHSSDDKNKKWEWGTHKDYLGRGAKLLLFDKDEPIGIAVIADVIPKEAFYDRDNYHTIRNVLKPFPKILEKPIPVELIKKVGLKDPRRLGLIPFEDITESQFNELMTLYERWKRENGRETDNPKDK